MTSSYASKTPTSCSTCRVLAPDELQAAVLAPCPGGHASQPPGAKGKSFTLEFCDFHQTERMPCSTETIHPLPFLQNSSVTTWSAEFCWQEQFPLAQFPATQMAPLKEALQFRTPCAAVACHPCTIVGSLNGERSAVQTCANKTETDRTQP